MSPVGFETTIPAFELAKTVHVLDRTVTVIGKQSLKRSLIELGSKYVRCNKHVPSHIL
jgi:hypothetical protein